MFLKAGDIERELGISRNSQHHYVATKRLVRPRIKNEGQGHMHEYDALNIAQFGAIKVLHAMGIKLSAIPQYLKVLEK